MPDARLNLSQLLIGATLGLRYRRDRLLALRRFLAPAVLSTVVLVGLNVATGAVIGLLVGLPVPTMALAVSPEIGRAHVELQSLMRISYAVFCLKKKKKQSHD